MGQKPAALFGGTPRKVEKEKTRKQKEKPTLHFVSVRSNADDILYSLILVFVYIPHGLLLQAYGTALFNAICMTAAKICILNMKYD